MYLYVVARSVPGSPAEDEDQVCTAEAVAAVEEGGGDDGDQGVELRIL